jgi:hypothetical protein
VGKKWSRGEVVLSSSLCQPAVRLVLVEVGVDEDAELLGTDQLQTWHQVLPIVALRTRIVVHISQPITEYTPERVLCAGSLREARAKGYEIDGRDEEFDAMVLNGDGVIGTVEEWSRFCSSTICEVVACSWPVEQDQERLAPHIKQLASKFRAYPYYRNMLQRIIKQQQGA